MLEPEIWFYRTTGRYGFLSNLYPCKIDFHDGKIFESVEAYYQYMKARDEKVGEWLISAPTPELIALAGHALLPRHIRSDWKEIKETVMAIVIKKKFLQNDELREKLFATGDSKLIEASRSDAFWGIGKRGNGKNKLGKILMETREELRRLYRK